MCCEQNELKRITPRFSSFCHLGLLSFGLPERLHIEPGPKKIRLGAQDLKLQIVALHARTGFKVIGKTRIYISQPI